MRILKQPHLDVRCVEAADPIEERLADMVCRCDVCGGDDFDAYVYNRKTYKEYKTNRLPWPWEYVSTVECHRCKVLLFVRDWIDALT